MARRWRYHCRIPGCHDTYVTWADGAAHEQRPHQGCSCGWSGISWTQHVGQRKRMGHDTTTCTRTRPGATMPEPDTTLDDPTTELAARLGRHLGHLEAPLQLQLLAGELAGRLLMAERLLRRLLAERHVEFTPAHQVITAGPTVHQWGPTMRGDDPHESMALDAAEASLMARVVRDTTL